MKIIDTYSGPLTYFTSGTGLLLSQFVEAASGVLQFMLLFVTLTVLIVQTIYNLTKWYKKRVKDE